MMAFAVFNALRYAVHAHGCWFAVLCRSYAAVMEEYAEAAIFKVFLTEGRMLKASELRELVQVEE